MSQIAFAELAGISVGCLQGFEAGTRATREHNLLKIAAVLGITKEALLGDDGPAGEAPHPLLENLKTEDLRVANAYHHADAEAKHAIKIFLSHDVSDETRERLALILKHLLAVSENVLVAVEQMVSAIDDTAAPPRPLVLPDTQTPRKNKS